jgi:hypothetical protein
MIHRYKSSLRSVLRVSVISLCLAGSSNNLYAQSNPDSYPTSRTLTPETLAASKRSVIETLINGKLTAKDFPKLAQEICPHNLSRAAVSDDSVKSSVADNRVAIMTELLFEKQQGAPSTFPEHFSFLLDFSPTRALLQHLSPRFTSDAAGFSVPLPSDMIRSVRVEGTMGGDILAFIPPVRECGLQALVACPRRYEKIDRLVTSPYALTGARFLVEAKADGVVASPDGKPLRVMASIRHTGGVSMPEEWFSVATTNQTTSVARNVAHDRSQPKTLPAFVPITSWPLNIAVESRVDIGTESKPLKTARKRLNIEISKFTVAAKPAVIIGKNSMSIEGGECYLISQWSEEVI